MAACVLQIEFYCNTAKPIRLHIISGCFHSIKAELSCCEEDYTACTAYSTHCLVLYRNSLLTPDKEEKGPITYQKGMG